MALEVIAFVIAVAGLVVSFKLTGSAARTVRKWYVISLCLALGGCLGSLSWLDAETSGRSNWASDINPFAFAGLFLAGSAMFFFNSIRSFRFRRDQILEKDSMAHGAEVKDDENKTNESGSGQS
ncbi:MAG: hypothetical protein R3F41_00940 [Gammaproteobacteria bacterium]|nr:hypothetical protein [Pseudomonadales bacterium]